MKHAAPYPAPYGVDSGLILMKLDEFRHLKEGWETQIRNITTKYNGKLKNGNQDILNVFFHKFPKYLHQLGCEYNFNLYYCQPKYGCDGIYENGIPLLHGIGQSFFRDTKTGIRKLFQKIESIPIEAATNPRLFYKLYWAALRDLDLNECEIEIPEMKHKLLIELKLALQVVYSDRLNVRFLGDDYRN